ncbi:hypothetical protein Aoki45_10520 [Algoriphagus sp. oki45]|uniref:gliding motility lipoprotein GldH n=1 Tax=Algoriphagus sp. oki45 TaxID=3067294 RepID=UPI0027F9E72A|nr:hypothetical protein Aoki45_10520 [Algoriphagus sp. oki45]
MNKYLWSGLISLTILLSSCGGDRLYEEFQSIEGSSWQVTDTLSYEIGSLGTEKRTDLIAVRYSDSYPFSNLYVRLLMEDSSMSILTNKLINIPLFDSKSGKPLGRGFGNTYTKYDTLPLSFPEETVRVKLVQYMRKEDVKGIEALGIKILKN